MYMYMYMYMCMYMFMYMYLFMYMYMFMYVRMHVCFFGEIVVIIDNDVDYSGIGIRASRCMVQYKKD